MRHAKYFISNIRQSGNKIRNTMTGALLLTACMNVYAGGWEGFYVGGQYGKAKSRTDWTYNNPNYFNTQGTTVLGSDFNVNSTGNIGGLYMGYNYLFSLFLIGVEGSLQKASLNNTTASPYFPATDSETTNINRFGVVKGRLGYAYESWLLSLGGGWATGKAYLSVQNAGNNVVASSSQWVNGWTTGTAIEYKITEGFSIGLAYDYLKLKLNNKTLPCSNCGTGVGLGAPAVTNTIKTNSVTTRLSYYFG
jgi:outer membrane immunogenic protein